MKKLYSFLCGICFQVLLYVIQYLILPNILQISPYDIAKGLFVVVISTVLLSVLGMAKSRHFFGWLIGYVAYVVLVFLYHPNNVYGIGTGMFDFDIITITILSFSVFVLETIVFAFYTLLSYWKKKKM